MAVGRAILDTSVVNRLSDVNVGLELEDDVAAGALALCSPVVIEVCHSARNHRHLVDLRSRLAMFPMVPVHQATFDRALEVQEQLAQTSRHRAVSGPDLLVAAAAEAFGLKVIHYDADFDLIASITGQTVEWVVPRGMID